jgi:hypothetical protein
MSASFLHHFGPVGTAALAAAPLGFALPPIESMAYFVGIAAVAIGSSWVVLAGRKAEADRKTAVEKASAASDCLLIKARTEAELLLIKARTEAELLLLRSRPDVPTPDTDPAAHAI